MTSILLSIRKTHTHTKGRQKETLVSHIFTRHFLAPLYLHEKFVQFKPFIDLESSFHI